MPFSGISFMVSASIVLGGSILSYVHPSQRILMKAFFTKILTFDPVIPLAISFMMIGGFFLLTSSAAVLLIYFALNGSTNAEYIALAVPYIQETFTKMVIDK